MPAICVIPLQSAHCTAMGNGSSTPPLPEYWTTPVTICLRSGAVRVALARFFPDQFPTLILLTVSLPGLSNYREWERLSRCLAEVISFP